MQSLLAAWRVSLHRTRADWPIVAAAGLIAVLAATLLAAGPIYSNAVSVAGLHRQLESAPASESGVAVDARIDAAEVGPADQAVSEIIRNAFGDTGVDVVAMGISGSYALPGQGEDVRDLATIGFIRGVEDHASLATGDWPAPAREDGLIAVAVLEPVAELLGLGVGDTLRLTSRTDADRTFDVQVSGIYRPTEPGHRFWWNDERLLNGIVQSEQYRTFGPLLAAPDDVLRLADGGALDMTWRGVPRIDQVAVDQLPSAPLPTRAVAGSNRGCRARRRLRADRAPGHPRGG